MLALWGSAALLIAPPCTGAWREGGSYGGASRQDSLALGGVVGAILAGVAPTNGGEHAVRGGELMSGQNTPRPVGPRSSLR